MNLLRKVFSRREGGKEFAMAEANPSTTANPPAASGASIEPKGASLDQVKALITESLQPIVQLQTELGKSMKVLADTMTSLPPAKPAEGGKKEDGPLTEARLQEILKQNREQEAKTAALSSQRDRFLTERLPKLPAVYRNQLGNDPAQWETEAKTLTAQYEADFKLAGGSATPVGTPNPSGEPVKSQLDPSKLTTAQFAAAFLPKVPGAVESQPPQQPAN